MPNISEVASYNSNPEAAAAHNESMALLQSINQLLD